MTLRQNTAEGGTNGTTVTTANSGGASGTAFTTISPTGTPTYQFKNDVAAHGTLSYGITATAGNYVNLVFPIVTAATQASARFYFYLHSLPSAGQDLFQILAGGASVAMVGLSGSNRLAVKSKSATVNTFPTVLSATTWYRVELQVQPGSSATDGTISCQYYAGDSTTPVDAGYSASNVDAGTAGVTNVQFGKMTSGTALDVSFDDIAWNDGTMTPIGTATNPAIPPTSNAGTDQGGIEPLSVVTLTGSDNDSDGTVAARIWRQVSGTTVSLSGSGANRTYSAPATLSGTSLVFGYKVTDNAGLDSDESIVTHTILPVTERAVSGGIEVPLAIRSGLTWNVQSGGLKRRGYGGSGTTRPTGAGYVRYEDLYVPGDTVTEAMARLTVPAIITFPEGQFFDADFAAPGDGCINIPKICRGIWGSGKGTLGGSTGTVFGIVPNSSTKAGLVPTQAQGGTNAFQVLRIVGSDGPLSFGQFQVAGTDQGHNYHGFKIYNPGGDVDITDVLVTGWQGDNGAPPGETFGLEVHMTKRPFNHTLTRVEADGRRVIGGTRYGTVGITSSTCVGGTWYDCKVQYCRASYAVFYRAFGVKTYNLSVGGVSDPGYDVTTAMINHEVTDDCEHYNPYIWSTQTNRGVHISHSNNNFSDTYSGTPVSAVNGSLKVVNPTWNNIWGNGRMYIESWTSGIDGSNTDSMVTPPLVTTSNGTTHIPYTWAHGTHQVIS